MITAVKANIERLIILIIAAVYIVQQLTHWEQLSLLLGILVFIAVAILLPQLRGLTLWLAVSFIAVGILILLLQKESSRYWLEAASINVTVVTLFVFAPLFGIPVRLPVYTEVLKQFFEKKMHNRSILFVGTQLLTQIMAVFLNVGSIPVVYHIVFVKPHTGMVRLLANAMNRGFGGAIFWSPYFAAMAVVSTSLSVKWSILLPYLLGLSLISLIVSVAVDYKELQYSGGTPPPLQEKTEMIYPVKPAANEVKVAFPVGLGVYLASAIAVILVLERWIELPMVMITCLSAVLLPLIWCLAVRGMATYRQGLSNHIMVTLPALKKEITLFLAAGFFSGAVGTTGFGAFVPTLLERMPLSVSLSFSIFTIAIITITSMIGLHPIVLVTILATSIDPAAVHISPNDMAILLIGSWGISNTISPVAAVNTLLTGLFKKPVHEIVLSNYKFVACMAVLLLLYVVAVGI